MKITEHNENGLKIVTASAAEGELLIQDASSALDFIMTIQYEYGTARIAIDKKTVADNFFILSTGIAGEILQKFINYHIKLAVFGDFTHYTSKPLQDFIRESNQGHDFFFVSDEKEAIEKLAHV